ncbi:hypothetical protein MLD38_033768 [Melastoma candidum]|uniref:Uncharacterized protein n=1 Tax=Melastoma candidum TaxID=119954 RepID=A0ACB9MC56_9MYRT|nr:hypothetical protein MLD38_033768 [Melastoma candidum]
MSHFNLLTRCVQSAVLTLYPADWFNKTIERELPIQPENLYASSIRKLNSTVEIQLWIECMISSMLLKNGTQGDPLMSNGMTLDVMKLSNGMLRFKEVVIRIKPYSQHSRFLHCWHFIDGEI